MQLTAGKKKLQIKLYLEEYFENVFGILIIMPGNNRYCITKF